MICETGGPSKSSPSNIVGITLAAVLLLAAASACGSKEQSWDRIRSSGSLTVGLDPTFPPFEFMEGEQPVGLDVDLIDALVDELDLQTVFRLVSYDGLYDALATGQVDLLISALVVLPERTRDFAFSDSYFDAGEILVVKNDEVRITSMEDVKGRVLGVELGARGHVEAINWSRRLPELKVQTFDSADDALAALTAGQVDASLVDAVSGRLYMSTHPGLRTAGEPVTNEPFVMVVRIEDSVLLDKLNERLTALRQSGQLEQIVGRWLPESAVE